MSSVEEEEDAEIQRQLLEAKQRIAYLKRQVHKEQKLRENESGEHETKMEGTKIDSSSPGGTGPRTPAPRSTRPPVHTDDRPQTRQEVRRSPPTSPKQQQHRRRQNNAVDEQEESKKVEELQQALSNSLQDTSAKRVPGALSGKKVKSRSRPSSRAGHDSKRENMKIPPRPRTSNGIPGEGRRPGASAALPAVSTPSPAKSSPAAQRPHTSHGTTPQLSGRGDGGESSARSGKKSRPNTAASSYTPSDRLSPTRKGYTQLHVDKAMDLATQPDRMASLLKDPIFLEATKRKGIEEKELIARPKSYFRKQSKRASLLSKEHAAIRFKHYESRRLQLLAMVLSEHEIVRAEIEKEAAMFKREDEKLMNGFYGSLKGEQNRLSKIKGARAKFQRVQANENDNIKSKRKKFNASKGKFQDRLKDILEQERAKAEKYRERGRMQKERIKQVSRMKDKMTKVRANEMQKRFALRDQRIHEKMEEKRMIILNRRVKDSGKQQLLKNKQALAKKGIEDRKQELLRRLHQKEDYVRAIRKKHAVDIEHKRIEKALQMQQRVENVARAKKEAEYKNQVMIKKMQKSWSRMERFKEIKEAIQIERGARRKRDIIERHKWRDGTVLERTILPGPGEYHNNKTDMANNTRGARWGKYKPKSDIDWIMYRSAQIPGPGQYTPVDPNHNANNGGTWGKYTPKSDVEWLMYYAEQKPGPGQYQIPKTESKKAVKWGDFEPMGEIDQIMSRAKHIPGPGQYAEKQAPLVKPKLSDIQKQLGVTFMAVRVAGKMKAKAKDARHRLSQSDGHGDAVEMDRSKSTGDL
jgi:hypothetical protein